MSWLTGLEHFIRRDLPLASRCWLRCGGPAAFFAEPATMDDLVELVKRSSAESLPLRLLGNGSNVLIKSAGLEGVTISLDAPAFGTVAIEGNTIKAGGGVALAHVITAAAGAGLAGLEPLIGIPGTVGGALHGNSGDRTTDVGDWVSQVTVLDRVGEVRTLSKEQMTFSYRSSSVDELAIIDATFQLEPESSEELTRRMQKRWIVKRASQPSSEKATACLFKDPIGMTAGETIEQAGLKNARSGGASLLDRDANFVQLAQDASSDDVVKLMEEVREKVSQQLGVELETSINIW